MESDKYLKDAQIENLFHFKKRPFINKIKDRTKLLFIPDAFKSEILNQEFIEEVLPIYLYYPYAFSDVFELEEEKKLDDLNFAGYLLHRSIITLDKILDNQDSDPQSIIFSNICQEESIKILAQIFPSSSEFWKIWNKRREEYLKAYQLDRNPELVKDQNSFEILADCKSAFGKIAIDALSLTTNQVNTEKHSSLLRSHKHYYCAMQILDDLNDLKEDIVNKQFNFAYLNIINKLEQRKISYDNFNPEEFVRAFYIFNVADDILQQALTYIRKAKEEIINLNRTETWLNELNKLNNIILTKKLNASAYIRQAIIERELSNKQVFSNIDAVDKGLRFIFNYQNKDGSWNEFFNEAGMSDTWSTSFVGFFIQSVVDEKSTSFKNLQRARKYVHNCKKGDLWGYNKHWINDADSSSFALLFLHSDVKLNSTESYNSIKSWGEFQKDDGGFTTYNDVDSLLSSLCSDENAESLNGWTQSHFCVSAVAMYLLNKFGVLESEKSRLQGYLLSALTDGLFLDYWWTEKIYSLHFLILNLSYLDRNSELYKIIENRVRSVVDLQNSDGSFSDGTVESPFYTALFVSGVLSNTFLANKYKNEISKSALWLRNNQLSDGSWISSNPMRIPDSSVVNPKSIKEYRVATLGVNIRVKEFSRLFTTAVSVDALYKYNQTFGESTK